MCDEIDTSRDYDHDERKTLEFSHEMKGTTGIASIVLSLIRP